ncbi:MAG: tRNA lysidine(34) synthetase TilS [Saprospiraceae bacterium]
MSLLARLLRFSEKNALLPGGARLLVAVSGGVDSVVLARLLAEARAWPLGLAHCNFQLRGPESDGDEAFVRDLAAEIGAAFFVQRFDTQVFAEQNNLSVQLAARQLRYQWFEKIRAEHGFDLIATAHNLNDSAETTIFNLVRGTGTAGLQGIPARNGAVVRPLLFAQRIEIEAFAREQNIAWREDSSNASDDYTRNFVRHHILPRMAELNPNLLETIARMQARVGEMEANFEHLAAQFWAQHSTENDGIQRIEKQAIAAFPSPKNLLFHWLRPHGFSEEQARQLAENLAEQPGLALVSADGFRVVLDRTHILLEKNAARPIENLRDETVKIEADDLMVSLPDGSKMVLLTVENRGEFVGASATTAWVAAENLCFPLLLRRWRAGDVFQPLGMDGKHQKLQDFFTNLKLSLPEKDRVWLLENGTGEIIWVVGHRPDERFKITPTTRKALKISWMK